MPVGIAAFAIEDRVDFRFSEIYSIDGRGPELLAQELFEKGEENIVNVRDASGRTADILGKVLNDKPGARDFIFQKRITGTDYFGAVEEAIQEALNALDKAFPAGGSGQRDVIDCIEAMVVSTAGVVTNAETLVQLPLWSFEPQEFVEWTDSDQKKHTGFNFVEVIGKHADAINGKNNSYLRNNIFVVNDAVASAAYVYSQGFIDDIDKPRSDRRRIAFLKVHNGVNAAFIVAESFTRRSLHPEFGHFYPILHPADLKNGFPGTCPYHLSCAEGMLSRRSLLQRAQGGDGWQAISSWNKEITGENDSEQERAMFKSKIKWEQEAATDPLPPPSADSEDAVDIVSFYIAQLLYQLLASPVVPDVVVVGGAYATEAVIAAARQRVMELARGYPKTIFGSRDDSKVLSSKIQTARAPNIRHIELNGALFIGLRRLSESTRKDIPNTNIASLDESHHS